jgi:hypothetical protein
LKNLRIYGVLAKVFWNGFTNWKFALKSCKQSQKVKTIY